MPGRWTGWGPWCARRWPTSPRRRRNTLSSERPPVWEGGYGDIIEATPWMMGAVPGAALAVHAPLVRLLSRLPLRVVAAPCPTPPEWPRLQNGDAVCPGVNHRAMPLPPLWADDRRRLAAAPGKLR